MVAGSFLQRFCSALKRHSHLHACVSDGVFRESPDAPPAFLPTPPITAADLATFAEKVLSSFARPPFAMERLSMTRDENGRITRVRYALLRHNATNGVGPARTRKSSRPGENGIVTLSPFEFLSSARRSRAAGIAAGLAAWWPPRRPVAKQRAYGGPIAP
jgi:hypothetical protein